MIYRKKTHSPLQHYFLCLVQVDSDQVTPSCLHHKAMPPSTTTFSAWDQLTPSPLSLGWWPRGVYIVSEQPQVFSTCLAAQGRGPLPTLHHYFLFCMVAATDVTLAVGISSEYCITLTQ